MSIALSTLAIGATALSGVVSGVGAVMNASAASRSAQYNAEIAANNAKVANQNATWAGQAGEQQAAVEEQKARARVGAIVASQAANNIDVNSGSAVDVRSSAAQLGELDALTVRSNAAKEAYGYENQAWSSTAQQNLDESNAAASEEAGLIGGTGDLLSGVASAGNQWRLWQAQSGGMLA